MDLTFFVGNLAIVCTIASSFSGLPVCLKILKRKSTSGVSSLPFICGAVNTTLWLQYGIKTSDNVVIFVNAIAIFLQYCYLLCYYCYADDKNPIRHQLVLTISLLFSIYWYTFHYVTKEYAVPILGLFASSGSILASAAPLVEIREVFAHRSTQSLPFPIIFGTFVVSGLWFTYGLLQGDSFIQVPNFIATAISGFQLSLFIVFGSKTAESKSE